MIKYLIKFVGCKDHADALLRGELFMHTATYYHAEERKYGKGRGDLGEASVFSGVQFYKNAHYPIYCMYTVYEEDIIGGKTRIDGQVLQDFNCEHGYLVLIDYKRFTACLNSTVFNGFASVHGKVVYGNPTTDFSAEMLYSDTIDNLFIKRECFQHQKEYRIAVYQVINDPVEKRMLDGMEVNYISGHATKSYYITGGIRDFSVVIPCNSLQREENGYILNLPKCE